MSYVFYVIGMGLVGFGVGSALADEPARGVVFVTAAVALQLAAIFLRLGDLS